MDLGLRGRWAIVGGASKGLGRACAQALAEEGVNVVIAARTKHDVTKTADQIVQSTGVTAIPVAVDLSTQEGRETVLAVCPNPDIVINNSGGPPPGDFRNFKREDWIRAIDANMFGAIEMIRLTVDGMAARGFGRIVNVTSSAVKAPISVLALSNAARSGLTGFVSGVARDVAHHNVTINNLLPGQFDTDRLRNTQLVMAKKAEKPLDVFRVQATSQIPAGRFGQPDEFGRVCAMLCSVHAGYVTAQNLLIDGGRFPGLL